MKDIPKPLLILFILLIAVYIWGAGAGFLRADDVDLDVVVSLRERLGGTFLVGEPIDLNEIRLAQSTPLQPNPLTCINRAERRFVIARGTTCRYLVAESQSPSRVLDLRLEQGGCVEVQIRQQNMLPVTLTLLGSEVEPDDEDDSAGPCSTADEPRLQMFKQEGQLTLACHDSGTGNMCVLVIPE